ncbi:MAG: GntR family transcriptional regulator [Mogibacterium sp.]|nr:GntR family transcriptional regulator [Mogibacterium sp.]
MEKSLKVKFDRTMSENPFTHLGDAVYSLLYKSIIRMDIPDDDLLSDTALAKELDVSRTPVHNALMRLQDDGLIVKSSGQGFRVAPLKEEECRHLMEVRLAVEGQAAMRAAERITDDQLRKLDELSEEYRNACDLWDPDAIIESDHSFHQLIVDASENPVLTDIYRQISPRVLHYRYYMFRKTGQETLRPVILLSVRIHQSVINAIRMGFSDTAQKQIERDIYGMTDIFGSW